MENRVHLFKRLRIWCCPACGRSVSAPEFYYAPPNTICQCQFPARVHQMVQVFTTSMTQPPESYDPLLFDAM